MINLPAKKHSAVLAIILLGSILITSFLTPTAYAITGADWRAGNIINDSLFYNNSSMSAEDIQYFLDSKVPTCDTQGTQSAADVGYPNLTHAQYAAQRGWAGPPYVCLKNYMQVPDSTQIISNFQGSTPAGAISAAQIIKNAADTYGVSPKVLLVTIHKESLNLIYDSWPTLSQYKNAMGYACPDTAPCDPKYAGFYNQINNAARQFKLYRDNISSYRYKPLQNNAISYQANAPSCGSSNVYIETYATAGLYNYTPYQPNQAALNNLYGTGDSCSAYGNRNFWRLYNDWFGSTQHEETFLSYKSHIGYAGWTGYSINHGITGYTGQSKTMEAFKINGSVEYTSYNYNSGWQPTVNNGMISGTTEQAKPIQAIKINPTGLLANKFDIYYRAHVSYVGWMGWAKNGQAAGVTGDANKNIEAFEIKLLPKSSAAPGPTDNSYQNINVVTDPSPLSLSVDSHIGGIGWQPAVTSGMVSGTTEQNRQIEAVKIGMNNTTGQTGNITYSAHLAYMGWQAYKTNNEVAGTIGEFRQMEALRIALTGNLSTHYDIWYRGYVEYLGWGGWAKNGDPIGSVGESLQLEAIETRIVPKNSISLPRQGSFHNPGSQPLPDSYTLSYTSHIGYVGWLAPVSQNTASGTTGQSKAIEAIRFDSASNGYGDISVDCSAYIKGSGNWTNNAPLGTTCGTSGQTKNLEALRLTLSGSTSNMYDIYYKVHLSYLGWQDWVKNGEAAGTPTSNIPIEAVIVKLVKK